MPPLTFCKKPARFERVCKHAHGLAGCITPAHKVKSAYMAGPSRYECAGMGSQVHPAFPARHSFAHAKHSTDHQWQLHGESLPTS